MGTGTFSDEFKRDAVAQITERGYSVFCIHAPGHERSAAFVTPGGSIGTDP